MKKWQQMAAIAFLAFAMSFAVKANSHAAAVTGVKQVDDSTTSVTLQCDADLSGKTKYHQVLISTDKVTYVPRPEHDLYLTNLTPGTSYWVKVVGYADYSYSTGEFSGQTLTESAPIEVVTAPETPNGYAATQAGATTTTVKIQVSKVSGANLYYATESTKYGDRVGTASTNVITAKVRTGAGTDIWFRTYCARKSSTGYVASGSYTYDRFTTVSKKTSTKNFGISSVWSYNNSCTVSVVNYGSIDGIQVQLATLKGKKTKTYTATSASINLSNYYGTFYKYRIRTYVQCSNSKACSAWSSYRYLGTPKKCSTSSSKRKIKVNWSKVSGVKDYVVYISNKENSGYKKVKTLSAKKRSITITKYKKKKLTKGKYYYIKVVPRAKVGKKKVTSDVIKSGSVYVSKFS